MDTRLEARGHILATEIIFSHKREIFGGGVVAWYIITIATNLGLVSYAESKSVGKDLN